MKKQKVLSALIVVCLLMNILSSFGSFATTEDASEISKNVAAVTDLNNSSEIVDEVMAVGEVPSVTNQYTYIRMAPYWTAEVVDTIAANVGITIIERDQSYFYIRYSNPSVKTGYIPIANVNTTSYDWCNHSIYSHGHNKANVNVSARYGPGSEYGVVGTVDNNEGVNSIEPLLVLGDRNGYYFVQYVTNPSATGSTQPKFKRGWVPMSYIQVDTPAQPPLTDLTSSYQYAFISNSNNEYLTVVADSSQASGYKVTFMSASGDDIQQWKFVKVNYTGQTYYKIYPAKYNLCLQIDGAAPIVGNKMILTTPSHPNKAQEFSFSGVLATDVAGRKSVRILPRCSGVFLALQKSGTDLCQYRAGESTDQYFRIDPIDNFWNGTYGTDETHLVYTVNSSAIVGNITANIIDTAATQWNGIMSGVSVTKAVSSYNNVTVMGVDLDSAYGQTSPVIDYSGTEYTNSAQFNDTWYGANIYLNTVYGRGGYMANLSEQNIQKVITHEFGHALKLRHPHEGTTSTGEYTTYRYVYSIMNQGPTSYNYVSRLPSEFDKRALQEKWS